ncbi:hypothetical protein [Vibrio profundum]
MDRLFDVIRELSGVLEAMSIFLPCLHRCQSNLFIKSIRQW